MFDLFKSKVENNSSVNVIIDEIHETFFTEVDRLLAEAKISKSLDTDKQDLIDKCKRLKKLGFTNTKEVKEAEEELKRLEQLKKENENKKNLIDAINYFTVRYPQYKFITEESVKKICKKYNLVYGMIDRYIGTVPDKNLKHIEDFKVLEEDEAWLYEYGYYSSFDNSKTVSNRKISSKKETLTEKARKKAEYDALPLEYKMTLRPHLYMNSYIRDYTVDMEHPLEIAAPLKDFNMTGLEVKDFKLRKIEIPDPVVLKPVVFNSAKYYLIVTAWGQEASDEIVVNQNMN
jgi:hypothetical protein